MMAKLALDNMLRLSVSAARLYLHKTIVDIIRAYKSATGHAGGFPYGATGPATAAQPQAYLPDELANLPLLSMALQVRKIDWPDGA